MKTLEEFKADAETYDGVTMNALIKKYRAFMNYMSRIIYVLFKDVEQELISWLNEDNNERLLISTCIEGIHYESIAIGLDNNRSHIGIVWFGAHDKYYDPKIDFDSTNEAIYEFFKREYDNFIMLYAPYDRSADRFLEKLVDRFNDAFYEKFKSMFKSVGLNDLDNFKQSKYALSFSDEKLSEMNDQILAYYDAFVKIAQDSSNTIEAAKITLCTV